MPRVPAVTRKCVVEVPEKVVIVVVVNTESVPDEVVPVLLWQGHEGAAHHYELNLEHTTVLL